MEDQNLTQGEKIIGALSYIIFFLPLINGNRKDFSRFHANQGLLLFITIILFNLLNIGISYFPYVDWVFAAAFLGIIIYLFGIGIQSASKGEMRVFPVIGKYKIIKSKSEKEAIRKKRADNK